MSRDISTEGDAFDLTPSDVTIYGGRGLTSIYVGTAGDVKIETLAGSTPTYKNVPAGTRILRACSKVFATGTTATDLVGEH
jgi:hypothetical protein